VERLEKSVRSLEKLPGQVKGLEFSAMRQESMATLASKQELNVGLNALRDELREDIAAIGRELAAVILELQRQTSMRLEDIISRLAVIAEGNPGPHV
jgi:hypothetical protein